jgi:hypothetical protein
MAGKIIVDTLQTESTFLQMNVGTTRIATMNASGIFSNTGTKMIGSDGTIGVDTVDGSALVDNTVTAAKIVSVANTQITGNITSSQIAPTQTFYGNTSITGLLDLSATNAGQIKFPASQNASSDANTLDDYEEGTWTPTITFNSGSATVANPVCQYTKIGRMVHISGRFTLTSVVSPSGACIIGSLPFNANNPSGDGNRVGIQIYFENATARIGDDIVGLIFDGGSTMDVRRSGTTGAGADLGGSVQSSTVFLLGGFYAST